MAVETFKKYINEKGIKLEILESDQSTHTAIDAAKVHGVPVSNIVKSLLVKTDDIFRIFLVPGDKRLDLESIKNRFQASDVRMAGPDEVKLITGYSIGGVPPFGYINKLEIYLEEGFDSSSDVVAAAGSNNSVFKCPLANLKKYINEV
jgi:prolyl-tRNA editing enzyme YbaK/EbsC (Cys-tRNA(Pro) deacylase)